MAHGDATSERLRRMGDHVRNWQTKFDEISKDNNKR
jgi:hypothetical protein